MAIQQGVQADLRKAIDQGAPPIVFIQTSHLSYWDIDSQHAILVSGYDGPDLLVNDPAFPDAPRRVSTDESMMACGEFGYFYALLTS